MSTDKAGRKIPLSREPSIKKNSKPVLITGGAGFVGCNVADRLLSQGQPVRILDNLSRDGVEQNLQYLVNTHGHLVDVVIGDVRDARLVQNTVAGCSQVFHFAAQVAVTTSLTDPVEDFEVNARGTLNVLEGIRAMPVPAPLVFTSTNKVYGGLDDLPIVTADGRYQVCEAGIREFGVSERRPLDFHSPYGCSKGTADQYVRDYTRSYGLPTIVFRMSCIYGPHQFGTEDQGWVAHFIIRALEGEQIVLYGDGMQVRDILFVEDLVNAFLLAQSNMTALAGHAFNIGGGVGNTISLLELLDLITEISGRRPPVEFEDWRTGDQRYYVSDTRRFQKATGWSPAVSVKAGVRRLYRWLTENGKSASTSSAVAGSISPSRAPERFSAEGGLR
jgi:CDP-paratose 2-epimerase